MPTPEKSSFLTPTDVDRYNLANPGLGNRMMDDFLERMKLRNQHEKEASHEEARQRNHRENWKVVLEGFGQLSALFSVAGCLAMAKYAIDENQLPAVIIAFGVAPTAGLVRAFMKSPPANAQGAKATKA